jgi:hypothetical protein
MDTLTHNGWKRIGSRPSNLWSAGILAVVNKRTNKAHFVATRNVGKRVRDQHYWLEHRTHHNTELQKDWDQASNDFGFFLVKRVCKPSLLNREKQLLINQFGKEGRCYNRKRSVPIRKDRPVPTSIEELFREIARIAESI